MQRFRGGLVFKAHRLGSYLRLTEFKAHRLFARVQGAAPHVFGMAQTAHNNLVDNGVHPHPKTLKEIILNRHLLNPKP